MPVPLKKNQLSDKADKGDVLVKVNGVSKIFCRNLKKSLLYGLKDSITDLFWPKRKSSSQREALRPEEFWANKNISFELRRGDCIGLIGHNGAGKTTLLKMLNGLIKPDSGSIEMRGRVGALIALGAGFNPILTGRENIYVNGSVLGLNRSEINAKLDEIIAFADIGEFLDSPVQNYSSGMQVRLGFAVASCMKPDILLLDEVLAVGDAAFQAKCFNKLAEMRREGVPFILVSHNMHQISRYCDNVVFMKRGKVEFIGDAEEGIRRFMVDMNQTNDKDLTGPNWVVTDGTGKVKLTGAKFLDGNGQPTVEVDSGSPLTLIVYFQCQAENIVDPVLDVTVRCKGDLVFQSTSRSNGTSFGVLPSNGEFVMKIKSLPYNMGPLDFNFCLLSGKSNELFDWKRDFRLGVIPDTRQTGSIFLETKWEIK